MLIGILGSSDEKSVRASLASIRHLLHTGVYRASYVPVVVDGFLGLLSHACQVPVDKVDHAVHSQPGGLGTEPGETFLPFLHLIADDEETPNLYELSGGGLISTRSAAVFIVHTDLFGDTKTEHIRPVRLFYGSSPKHQQAQWLLEALNVGTQTLDVFDVMGIHQWSDEYIE